MEARHARAAVVVLELISAMVFTFAWLMVLLLLLPVQLRFLAVIAQRVHKRLGAGAHRHDQLRHGSLHSSPSPRLCGATNS